MPYCRMVVITLLFLHTHTRATTQTPHTWYASCLRPRRKQHAHERYVRVCVPRCVYPLRPLGGGVNLDSQRLRRCRSLCFAVMYRAVGMADMRAVHAQAIQAGTEQEELKALNSLEEVFKRHKWVC